MGFYNKFLDFIGIEEEEDKQKDDFFEEEEEQQSAPKSRPQPRQQQQEQEPKRSVREQRLQGGGEAVSMPGSSAMKMIVYHPVNYEDAQNIIDNLKVKKPVIVNMEELEVATAQRILDFLSGAIYALSGTIMKISSKGIFVMAPNNYDVIGSEDGNYSDDM